MNTNTSPHNLPSVEALQELANQFFKDLPDEAPKDISLNPYEHPRATAFAKSVTGEGAGRQAYFPTDELTSGAVFAGASPVSSFVAPPAVGGGGVSPGLPGYGNTENVYPSITQGNTHYPLSGYKANPFSSSIPSSVAGSGASLSAPKTSLNFPQQGFPTGSEQQRSTDGGRIPASVAGSGASPSYVHQQEHFSIADPVTSFPDANIDKPDQQQAPLALSRVDSYWSDIESILKLIHTSEAPLNGLQLPVVGNEATQPSFYFLRDEPATVQSGGFTNTFDAYKIKKDFPILSERVNGKQLVWLDNAATTQKPQAVIDRINYFYAHENSNIHRAAHELAARATDAYEAARKKVQTFIGAKSPNEIIFVRGATEAINLVAQSWGEQYLKSGDEIIVSHLEHHANIVPWKRLADKKGIILKVIPVDDDGQILLGEYGKLLNPKTKLVAFTQVSNALGTITPAEQMVAMAHAAGAKVLVDGAQSVSHMPVNVQALDADWFVFSGHKVFGPTGIGVVYGKEELLNSTEPWQGGGNMIQDVTFEHIQYHKAPGRFEAGTGNIADAVGLGAAIDYVTHLGMANIGAYEHALLEYATHHLKQVPGVRLIGTAATKASVLSFTLRGFTNDEVGKALNREGIAVRTGHHCAQPILRRMGVESTVRPSLAFYNTCEDVDRLVAVVRRLQKG